MNLFGENLTFLRKTKGLTQAQVSENLNIGKVTWSDYERGKSEPSISLLLKISEFFVVDIDSLLKKDLTDASLSDENGLAGKNGKSIPKSIPNQAYKVEESNAGSTSHDAHKDEIITAQKETIEALKSLLEAQKEQISLLKTQNKK
jgi:transcriptional regulator with XRE-family HTH domain